MPACPMSQPAHPLRTPASTAFLTCVVMCDNCDLVPLTAFAESLKGSRGNTEDPVACALSLTRTVDAPRV